MISERAVDERHPVVGLFRQLLACWNRRDARGMAALFLEDGECVGFDGSLLTGAGEIETSMAAIFTDHRPPRYVAKVRTLRELSPEVAVVNAVAGMVAEGTEDVDGRLNAVQGLVGVLRDGSWRVALFQNTPAAFHGRPDAVESLTAELRHQYESTGLSGAGPA